MDADEIVNMMQKQIDELHDRINRTDNKLRRVANNPAPTIPIYDPTNFPQDAVEGQIAIGNDAHLYHYVGGIWNTDYTRMTTLNTTIDGGGDIIPTGIVGDSRIDFDCRIIKVALLADQIGSVVVDIWKDTYANFPPTITDSITASDLPTLIGESKYQDPNLFGWNTTINAGDTLRFNINSVSSIERLDIILTLLAH